MSDFSKKTQLEMWEKGNKASGRTAAAALITALGTLLFGLIGFIFNCRNLGLVQKNVNMIEKDYNTRTGSFITPSLQMGIDTLTLSVRNYGFATVVIDSVVVQGSWKVIDTLEYSRLLYLFSSTKGFYNFHFSLRNNLSSHVSTDTLVAIPLFLKADSSLPILKINRRTLPDLFDSAEVIIRYRSAVGQDSIIERKIPLKSFIPYRYVQFIKLNEAIGLKSTTGMTSSLTVTAIPNDTNK